jgi:integrase
MQAIGADDVTTHDLRRTFGSVAASSGVEINVLSKLLSHKNIQTTMRAYAHLYTDAQKGALDKIAAGLAKMTKRS